MKLTNNFTLEELYASNTATKMKINNTPGLVVRANLHHLAEWILQPIRDKWGSAIVVNSGYRCISLNKAVKGSSTSQHLTGSAADIVPANGDTKGLFELIKSMIENGEIKVGQLIDEYNYRWVHVSLPMGTKQNQILHLS